MALQFVQKRAGGLDGAGAASAEPADAKGKEALPALWEFLCAAVWDDGTERETGTLLIFVDDGVFKACLNDRDQQGVGFVTCKSLSAALQAADKALREGKVDWRAARAKGGPRRK